MARTPCAIKYFNGHKKLLPSEVHVSIQTVARRTHRIAMQDNKWVFETAQTPAVRLPQSPERKRVVAFIAANPSGQVVCWTDVVYSRRNRRRTRRSIAMTLGGSRLVSLWSETATTLGIRQSAVADIINNFNKVWSPLERLAACADG